MHEYDAALKLVLQGSADSILRQLTGLRVATWLNAEIPYVQTSRADLLGATLDGLLLHVELQSTNDPEMLLRMAEYALRIYRQYKKFLKQIVLYVGELPLRMATSISEPDPAAADFTFRYTLIDIRDIDPAALLASSQIGDNLLAILTRVQDRTATVREILRRIANLDEPARRTAWPVF